MALDKQKLETVLAAFALMAEAAEGPLEKKPNVEDVEGQVGDGFRLSAAERDEAWEAFQKNDGPKRPDAPVQPPGADRDIPAGIPRDPTTEEGGATPVRNNLKTALNINGVQVPPGEVRPIPGLDRKQFAIARWIELRVISVAEEG